MMEERRARVIDKRANATDTERWRSLVAAARAGLLGTATTAFVLNAIRETDNSSPKRGKPAA
jgi:hypothetical protein